MGWGIHMGISEQSLRDMYLDLMRDILINEIYKDPPMKPVRGKLKKILGGGKYEADQSFDVDRRTLGQDWPSVAHSMIGRKRMDNLRLAVSSVVENGVPGDMVETGVWRGGACIYMRAILKSYGATDRTVWVCDSFEGLPKPDAAYVADKDDMLYKAADVLAISKEQVANNFRIYGLLDDQVSFLKGWFKDTLPTAPIDQIAVLRLDGDMYQSTMDALQALYPKVSPGGYVIIDDYHALESCSQAVHDYLKNEQPDEVADIKEIDGTGVYWVRQSA